MTAGRPLCAGLEAGGTKMVCLIGGGPDDIRDTVRIDTRGPDETLAEVTAAFRALFDRHGRPARLGIASFGPVDRDPGSVGWGHITATPKPGWAGVDIAGGLARALALPVAFDTDVNGAALAESLWGAGQGLDDLVYVTVGTGIGGGALSGGRLVHGALHPEMGHMAVPHDLARDPYPGRCPFHGDCLEGLACGPAIAGRWGAPGDALPDDHPAWALEADYLSALAANLIYTLAPRKILFGGGVMQRRSLLDRLRRRTAERLGGYTVTPAYGGDLADVISAPGLGDMAGPLGALALAMTDAP